MKQITTKELNSKAFSYILDAIAPENYGVDELKTDKEKLQFLAKTFKKEYVFPDNLKRFGNYQNLFAQWIMGLPSVFNIDFTNYDILQLAKKWGSIPADATEKQEDKIIANWFNFVAAKTFVLFGKHKIDSYRLWKG